MFTRVAFFILLVLAYLYGSKTDLLLVFSASAIYWEVYLIRKSLEKKEEKK